MTLSKPVIHYNSVLEMTGQGEEWLVDKETDIIMAIFLDGEADQSPKRDPKQSEIQTVILVA